MQTSGSKRNESA